MKISENFPLIITDDNILYINSKERQKFISKVYTTVTAQILYTIFFISLAYNLKPINDFMIDIKNFIIFRGKRYKFVNKLGTSINENL